MRYTIRILYSTGNSYGSHEETDELGITWTDLSVAKEALCRIKLHDEHYRKSQRYRPRLDAEALQRELEALPGFVDPNEEYCAINFPLDDGTEHRHNNFWQGYFEQLRKAEIILVEEDSEGMVYEPG